MTPNNHLRCHGCKSCGYIKNAINQTLSLEQFIKKAKKIHGNKYDYSKVEYHDMHTKICIICPKHDEFWQTPHTHLKGYGCNKCSESTLENKCRLILEKNNIDYIPQKQFNWLGRQSLDFYLLMMIYYLRFWRNTRRS